MPRPGTSFGENPDAVSASSSRWPNCRCAWSGSECFEVHAVGDEESAAPGEPVSREDADQPRVLVRALSLRVGVDVDIDGGPERMMGQFLTRMAGDEPRGVATAVVVWVDQPLQMVANDRAQCSAQS